MQSPQPSVGQPAPDTSTPSRLRIAPGSIVVFCVVFWAIPLVGLLIGQYIDSCSSSSWPCCSPPPSAPR